MSATSNKFLSFSNAIRSRTPQISSTTLASQDRFQVAAVASGDFGRLNFIDLQQFSAEGSEVVTGSQIDTLTPKRIVALTSLRRITPLSYSALANLDRLQVAASALNDLMNLSSAQLEQLGVESVLGITADQNAQLTSPQIAALPGYRGSSNPPTTTTLPTANIFLGGDGNDTLMSGDVHSSLTSEEVQPPLDVCVSLPLFNDSPDVCVGLPLFNDELKVPDIHGVNVSNGKKVIYSSNVQPSQQGDQLVDRVYPTQSTLMNTFRYRDGVIWCGAGDLGTMTDMSTIPRLVLEDDPKKRDYNSLIAAGKGKILLDTDVNKLVQSMASFSPPAVGQTTIPSNINNIVAPVIAANWR